MALGIDFCPDGIRRFGITVREPSNWPSLRENGNLSFDSRGLSGKNQSSNRLGKAIHMQMWRAEIPTASVREKNSQRSFEISACDWPGNARLSLFPESSMQKSAFRRDCSASSPVSARLLTAPARRGCSSTTRQFSYRSREYQSTIAPSRHTAPIARDAASPFASRHARRSRTASVTRI